MRERSIGEIKLPSAPLPPSLADTRTRTMQNYVHINYKLVRYISLARCRLLPSFPPSLLAPLPLFLSSVSLSDANRTAAMNVSPMICYSTAEEEEEEEEEEGGGEKERKGKGEGARGAENLHLREK